MLKPSERWLLEAIALTSCRTPIYFAPQEKSGLVREKSNQGLIRPRYPGIFLLHIPGASSDERGGGIHVKGVGWAYKILDLDLVASVNDKESQLKPDTARVSRYISPPKPRSDEHGGRIHAKAVRWALQNPQLEAVASAPAAGPIPDHSSKQITSISALSLIPVPSPPGCCGAKDSQVTGQGTNPRGSFQRGVSILREGLHVVGITKRSDEEERKI